MKPLRGGTIGEQASGRRHVAGAVDRRHAILLGEIDDQAPLREGEDIRQHEESPARLGGKGRNHWLDAGGILSERQDRLNRERGRDRLKLAHERRSAIGGGEEESQDGLAAHHHHIIINILLNNS